MIKADELKELTDLEKEILRRSNKGYNYAQVPYFFEKHSLSEIGFIKYMLLEHGYSVDKVRLGAGSKEVGVILNIFW